MNLPKLFLLMVSVGGRGTQEYGLSIGQVPYIKLT